MNFLFKIVFVQEVSSAATAAVAADEAAADEVEPTAGPSGLCGRGAPLSHRLTRLLRTL